MKALKFLSMAAVVLASVAFVMKRRLTTTLALALGFFFATCGGTSGGDNDPTNPDGGTSTPGNTLAADASSTDATASQNPPDPSTQRCSVNGLSGTPREVFYDSATGRYMEASGVGTIRNYAADGTCCWYSSVKYNSVSPGFTLFGQGDYTAENGVIRITNGTVEDGDENGQNLNRKGISTTRSSIM